PLPAVARRAGDAARSGQDRANRPATNSPRRCRRPRPPAAPAMPGSWPPPGTGRPPGTPDETTPVLAERAPRRRRGTRRRAAGRPVTVWNRTAATAAPLARVNAGIAATPGQAVAGADVVITMLTDAAAVEAALFGASDGPPAVAAMRPGAVVVQMSTIAPD